MTDAELFDWLATRHVNSVHLERNGEHACNYMTAADWIEGEMADKESEFHECDQEELQAMRDTDTIWSLQIYPSTPIGFYRWVAPTLRAVIEKAVAAWPEVRRNYPGIV